MNTKPRNQCIPADVAWLVALDHQRQCGSLDVAARNAGRQPCPGTPLPIPAVKQTKPCIALLLLKFFPPHLQCLPSRVAPRGPLSGTTSSWWGCGMGQPDRERRPVSGPAFREANKHLLPFLLDWLLDERSRSLVISISILALIFSPSIWRPSAYSLLEESSQPLCLSRCPCTLYPSHLHLHSCCPSPLLPVSSIVL